MANPLIDRSWPLLRRLIPVHEKIYRLSGGLIGEHLPGAPPMLLLDHVGAKSGKRRTSPLAYLADGDNVVLVASKGGHPRNPAWFHNLRAHPEVEVQIGRERRPMRARVARRRERKRLWPLVVELYDGYADYQRRTEREIPLVILEPRGR